MDRYNLRDIKLGLLKPVDKKKTEIPKQSEKRKVEQRKYIKLVAKKAKEDDRCKIKAPGCAGKMQGLDHLRKRGPNNFLDEKNCIQCCNSCNVYKELNPIWAKNNGFAISRFKKN